MCSGLNIHAFKYSVFSEVMKGRLTHGFAGSGCTRRLLFVVASLIVARASAADNLLSLLSSLSLSLLVVVS